MPRLPTYRQKILPSTNIGAAPLDPNAASQAGGAIGQGIAALGKGVGDLGESLFKIEAQKQAIRDDAAVAEAISAEKEFARQTELEYENKTYSDPKEIAADRQNMLTRIGDFRASQAGGMSQRAFAEYKNRSKVSQDIYHRRFEGAIYKSEVSFAQSQAGVRLGTAYSVLYDPNASTQQKIDAQETINLVKDGYKEYFDPFILEATAVQAEYQAIIDNGGTKEMALSVIDKAAKAGLITPDQKHVLSNRVDSYAAGRVQQTKSAAKLTTHQSYLDLIPKLLDPSFAQQRYDLVDQSRLNPKDKEKWQEYIKGSYKESPTKTDPDGYQNIVATIFEANRLEISPKEAYDQLLTERFKERGITDEQFRWAINKIENPYPKHLIEDIDAAASHNLKAYRVYEFGRKNKKSVRVTESLLEWVDNLIKEDKVPMFDFAKKLYAMSRQFRFAQDSWQKIGDEIEEGGATWVVIDFDVNGEPIVERVD